MDERTITGAWDYATTLGPRVRVGQGCFLERCGSFERVRSKRDPAVVIGDRVRVYTWTTFNVEPSGYVEIGDESVLVGGVFMCAAHIHVGRRVIISYNVTIADSDFHPIDPALRKLDTIATAPGGDLASRPPLVTSPVRIDDDAWIGIGAIILKGVHIGRGARVEAGAVVTRSVPDGTIVTGNPARVVEGD